MPIAANFIGGERVPASTSEYFETLNPATGRTGGRFPRSTADDVDRAVADSKRAFATTWKTMSASQRGRAIARWGDLIAEAAEEVGRSESVENGKLLTEMRAQANAAAPWLHYFGGLSDKIEGTVVPNERPSIFNYTLREPLGVIGVIVPWNSPTFITIMSVAPALAAGNTVVIKPSEVTPSSALILAELAIKAGLPAGVVNVVCGERAAGEALVDHPDVRKIVFTGGEFGGKAVASRTGQRLVNSTLELGGKSANIVFGDASLMHAESGVLAGIFAAAGQTCVAGSRALVHRSLIDEFSERLASRSIAIRLGDPLAASTQMGPVATRGQLDKDMEMIARATSEGATLVAGGSRASIDGLEDGFFLQPTILRPKNAQDFIMQEEVFGPVLSVFPFDDDEEAVAIANGTRFGLAAGVWTRDFARAHRMARELHAGTVWINTYRALAPASPFGGVRASGTGRQNGQEAVYQYLTTKSVWCELGDDIQDPFVIRT